MNRLLVMVIFLGVFLTLGYTALNAPVKTRGPAPKAEEFLSNIQAGNYKAAVEGFGTNTCRCPGSLGWVSYLVYASNESQNLAFLFGKEFKVGEPQARQIATTVKPTSFLDRPEDWEVNVPIIFDFHKYQPRFLPLAMAYGYEMTENEFQNFLDNPDAEAWRGFCLRLRPDLTPGGTALPAAAKALEKPGNDSASRDRAVSGANDKVEEMARNLFGEDHLKYLHPADAGTVKRQDGSEISREEILQKLPRLERITLKLHMVRRDQRLAYSVFQFLVVEPIIALPQADGSDRRIKLNNYLAPVFNENNGGSEADGIFK